MKIENAKNLLIYLQDQISKNLPDNEKDNFIKEFDSLIDTCPDHSRAYSEFCVKLLERCRSVVKLEYEDVILSIDNIILLFKNKDSTEQQFKDAADAAAIAAAAAAAYSYAASAAADAAAYAYSYAAYAAIVVAAIAAADAADAASASAARKEEYNNQSIDLLHALKKKGAGRPKGAKNKVAKEKKEQLWFYPRFVNKIKRYYQQLIKEENAK
jgi:hypothetical protein